MDSVELIRWLYFDSAAGNLEPDKIELIDAEVQRSLREAAEVLRARDPRCAQIAEDGLALYDVLAGQAKKGGH